MSFLFKPKPKSPAELAGTLKEASLTLQQATKVPAKILEKATKDATKSISYLKNLFVDRDPDAELIAELSQEAYNVGLLETICETLGFYDFESRKSAAIIFNGILRRQIGARTPTVDYIYHHQEILGMLLKGYESKDVALNCGMMLRECIKFEQLAQCLIESSDFYRLFEYIELPTFDIASDAFATFETLLTKHKMFTATLLMEAYERIVPEFNKLLCSENYVTRRQTLKLVVELLQDPVNDEVKRRYLMSSDNLKIVMNLMRDASRSISLEAFKLFRMFLDNPTRPKAVHDILVKNQEKLLVFMDNFNADDDDDEFLDDKHTCLSVIGDLVPRSDSLNSNHPTGEQRYL